MKKFAAIIVNEITGEEKSVSEDSREVLAITLHFWVQQGWAIEKFI